MVRGREGGRKRRTLDEVKGEVEVKGSQLLQHLLVSIDK